MNTPILTSQDAFSAMMAGKNILCRAVGEMLDFNDLDQFPATIFAQPGYEFCVKIDTIEVAGITFTVPLTLDEIEEGRELFVVNTYGLSIYIADFSCAALTDSVNAGFVQRDAENAKLQLQAMSKLMGRELSKDLTVVRLGGDKPKTPRKTKAKAPVVESVKVAPVETDSPEITAVDEAKSNIVTFKDRKDQAEHVKLLREKIDTAQSSADLNALLSQIRDVGGEHGHMLMVAYTSRNDALTKPQALTADELKRLTLEAESSISQPVDEEEIKRQQLLDDLLKNIVNAQTPVEVNAQFRYARGWTAEQCKPLHVAISKRLVELDDSKPVEVQTLMGLIQHAPDLTALDVLEVDVGARAPDMQKKLMAEVLKRRKVLEGVA